MSQPPEIRTHEFMPICAECNDDVPNYEPEYCCEGRINHCPCLGQPLNLPFCSDLCEETYTEKEDITQVLQEGGWMC